MSDPNELTLAQRLAECGLLPGDDVWPDDLLSSAQEVLGDWVDEIVLDTPNDRVVHEAALAQIRRLLPDMDEVDRTYLMLGMSIMQVWFYTFLMGRADVLHDGGLPLADEQILQYTEHKLTVLCTMLAGMGDDVDMTAFEALVGRDDD